MNKLAEWVTKRPLSAAQFRQTVVMGWVFLIAVPAIGVTLALTGHKSGWNAVIVGVLFGGLTVVTAHWRIRHQHE
jgi:hypothetical protein